MNQPSGFVPSGTDRPRQVRGRRHDYIYYPVAWTDSSSGRYYEKGYYDENGERYEDVAFARNGRYENVVCHCPYCGQDSLLNLDAEQAGAQSLRCPYCGAPTEIRSQLDELLTTAAPLPESGQGTAVRPKKKQRGWLIAAVVLLALYAIGRVSIARERPSVGPDDPEPGIQLYQTNGQSNPELFGETIALRESGGGAYAVTGGGEGDKLLVWSAYDDSYYDASSDCYLWYNTDVEPPLWQYWYEGISSDFGDWGWMEYEDGVWYIERADGDWIELPERYDSSSLRHIEG